MHPVLIHLWGYSLPSFGMMLALAIIIGAFWISKRATAIGKSPDVYIEGLMWMMLSAIVGARLFYIAFFPQLFWTDPVGLLFAQGGLVWYGGVVGFCLATLVYTRKHHISVGEFADVMAPPAALGLAIGRIGCFLAGCCYGDFCTVPWAVQFPLDHPTHGLPVHPTQLYESICMVGVAAGLTHVDKIKAIPGQTTCILFVVYGMLRFGLEYLRGDRLVWLVGLNLSASQVLSLLAILLGIFGVFYLNRRKPGSVQQNSSPLGHTF